MIEGDRLTVYMAGQRFPWQTGNSFEAVYVCGPRGEGDLIVLALDDGTQIALNGNSSEFVAIVRHPNREGVR